jgi:hypothetical protein
MRPKLQKQSALKFVGRIIPRAKPSGEQSRISGGCETPISSIIVPVLFISPPLMGKSDALYRMSYKEGFFQNYLILS